ncbi:serine hydrolase [Actinocorallia lasiicapitis]
MLRKLTAALLTASMVAAVPAVAEAKPKAPAAVKAKPKYPPGVKAKHGILYDSTKKKILWQRDANRRMQVGSINKVALAMVVINAGGLNKQITVTQKYLNWLKDWNASDANIALNDRLTVRQLLNASLIMSGCEAAYALADAYGGRAGYLGTQAKMTALAKKLGMKNTNYASFDGTPNTKDYTTAADQLKMVRYAMKNPVFAKIVKTQKQNFYTPGGHSYTWENTNRLLWANGAGYPGLYGIKTGTTTQGNNFAFVARRAKRTVFGILLRSPGDAARWSDTTKALNWVYNTRTVPVIQPDTVTREIND